jgi:sialic acid synthase
MMTQRALTIGNRTINQEGKAYVIAEVGHNHQGSVELCLKFVAAAKSSGADAVKLQKRNNSTLYTPSFYDQPYLSENAFGATYGEHREALEFGLTEYREIQAYCKEIEIDFFATAFDLASVDFLHDLGVPAIKIASGDLRSTPLLQYASQTGIPLIVSTGASSMDDVIRAHDAIREVDRSDLAILQCSALYPAPESKLELKVISSYLESFPNTLIGFSSHDKGTAMSLVAYALGARIVEKHFTLDRTMKGTDHAFSLEPAGMLRLTRDLANAHDAMGQGKKRLMPEELGALEKMGKKLIYAKDLEKGTVISEQMVEMRSPANGITPSRLPELLGRTLRKNVAKFEDVDLDHF